MFLLKKCLRQSWWFWLFMIVMGNVGVAYGNVKSVDLDNVLDSPVFSSTNITKRLNLQQGDWRLYTLVQYQNGFTPELTSKNMLRFYPTYGLTDRVQLSFGNQVEWGLDLHHGLVIRDALFLSTQILWLDLPRLDLATNFIFTPYLFSTKGVEKEVAYKNKLLQLDVYTRYLLSERFFIYVGRDLLEVLFVEATDASARTFKEFNLELEFNAVFGAQFSKSFSLWLNSKLFHIQLAGNNNISTYLLRDEVVYFTVYALLGLSKALDVILQFDIPHKNALNSERLYTANLFFKF